MTQACLSLTKLLDLVEMEAYRGIIDKTEFLQNLMQKGMPRIINDARGAVRLAVERKGDDFLVTQYITPLALETIGEIY